MEKSLLLVAGIDPGTTVGFCVLEMNGRVVSLQSSKALTLDRIIEKTVHLGRLVIVGCDKRKVPEFVSKYAAQFRAKTISPDHDLSIEEKRELVGTRKTINSHEFDSLASALFCLKETAPLLRKIRFFVKQQDREDLFSEVAEIVIKRGIAIRLAYDMVTEPQKEEVQIARKLSDEETIPRKRVLRLYENLAQEKETVARLVKQNGALESELGRQKSLIGYLKKKMSRLASDEKREESVRRRQEQINGLRSQMQAMVSEIAELKQELSLQRSMLSEAADKIFAKKLRNLGMQEFEKKSQFLKIKERDILLVDDPNILSEAVIQKINEMENLLIVKKRMSEKTMEKLDIIVVNASSIKMQESSYFAAVDKKTVERIRSDPGFLKKLIREYQASRK